MQINPYLLFDGCCRDAFEFYAECFGGKIDAMISHRGTPAEGHVAPEWVDKIMHARMTVGVWVLMGSDAPPDRSEGPARGFSVHYGTTDPQDAVRVFQKLAEGGTVKMAIQPTFWASQFGMLVDRFGIPWMVNCEAPR
jgi:PhnB protein